MPSTESIKRSLGRRRVGENAPSLPALSTGSTVLNLACTGTVGGGFLPGHYYSFVGDSNSGKTFICMTCFAEASINPAFDDYRLIYDGTENGAIMNIRKFFGEKAAKRIEPPEVGKDGMPVNSSTVEEMYYHIDDAIKDGRPFIYVQDSQDSLGSESENAQFDTDKGLHKDGKGPKGTYGDSKAKIHSSKLRRLMGPLKQSGSILIIINQTRDSFSMFESSTTSGGRALLFYATFQLWATGKAITREYKGKKRQLGVMASVRIKKNRETGRDRSAKIPIYHSFGIDDVGGCIDYLIEEGQWKKSKSGVIEVTGLGPTWTGVREKVAQRVEEDDMVDDLRELVKDTWDSIEAALAVKRKSRYG